MRKVKVITDSCSDLSPEVMEKYGIDYAKMSTVFEGEVSPARLEWTRDEAHAFYNLMREGKRITTTQVPVEEFNRIFTKYLAEGCDIVYIACSSKQSGSVNTGSVAASKLMPDYPDAKILCIDSLNASNGEGILAVEAAKLAAAGKGADEIAEYITSIRKTVNQFVTVHTLDYLKRSGRVTASSAFFGNLMGVKPIIIADKIGAQSAFKKVKGRDTSLCEIVALLKDGMINPEEQTVYVAHADCSDEEVERLVSLVRNNIPCKDINVGLIGPIIGASIGPDAVAVFGFGKEITFCGQAKD